MTTTSAIISGIICGIIGAIVAQLAIRLIRSITSNFEIVRKDNDRRPIKTKAVKRTKKKQIKSKHTEPNDFAKSLLGENDIMHRGCLPHSEIEEQIICCRGKSLERPEARGHIVCIDGSKIPISRLGTIDDLNFNKIANEIGMEAALRLSDYCMRITKSYGPAEFRIFRIPRGEL